MSCSSVRERPIAGAFDEETINSNRCVDRVLADILEEPNPAFNDPHVRRALLDEMGDRMVGERFE